MKEILSILEIIFQFSLQFGIIQTIIILSLLSFCIFCIKPIGDKVINFFVKKIKKINDIKHEEALQLRTKHAIKIQDILEALRIYFNCNKALIIEYHNGGTNLTGLSFKHMSATYESNALGEEDMASDFTKTPLTLHPMFMKDLEETDCLYINIEDNVKTYQSLCQTLKRRNVVDAVAVPLYGIHEPIGFILLMSNEPKILQDEDKTEIHREAQKIANLLDFQRSDK